MIEMASRPTSPRPPARVLVIGCGNRGTVYSFATLQFPELGTVHALADPKPARLAALARRFAVPQERLFASHVDMLDALDSGRLRGDAAVVAVPDSLHATVVERVSGHGLHILCEKPMATSIEECVAISRNSLRSAKLFGIGHVLRYTQANMQLKALLDSGVIGPLVALTHIEPVGWFHFAHSYVRGNWRSEKESSFTLLTKSCHDLDVIHWFVGDHDNAVLPDGKSPSVTLRNRKEGKPAQRTIANPMERVAAFGGRNQFRKERKPKDAGDARRCLDCAYEPNCPYSAKRLYLDPLLDSLGVLDRARADVPRYSPFTTPVPRSAGHVGDIEDTPIAVGWPVDIVVEPPVTVRKVRQALREGRYGTCIYESDNDVPDNYALSFSFRSGLTGTFTLVSTSIYETGLDRRTRICGARGELETDGKTVKWTDFTSNSSRTFDPYADGVVSAELIPDTPLIAPPKVDAGPVFSGGHGGGDPALMYGFLKAIALDDASMLRSSAIEALESHIYVFAAEESRRTGRIVDVNEFRQRVGAALEDAAKL
ncbi:hypothetical protein DFJ74DRAFT_681898 [Hyaloraphidium curvatum]|nr:hypothetical protein DFJ74DRAFT_681898 [Hyaloraphidium curvatum]